MRIEYKKYYTYPELSEVLRYFESKYPAEFKLSSLGVTEEGRDIFLAEISENVHSDETKNKPAYYIQGSLHSSEPGGGTVALHLIETLLTEKPDILKDVVFYIVPRVNPDGVEANLLHNACTRSKNGIDERKKENV